MNIAMPYGAPMVHPLPPAGGTGIATVIMLLVVMVLVSALWDVIQK